MATVYLPVEATIPGMTSAERATAINAEVWSLRRPDSVKSPNDVTRYYYPQITHPTTGQVAIVGDTDEQVRIHPDVDVTELLLLLPEVPQAEKDGLVAFIDANRGGSVPFGQLIPSTSEQLTQVEAEAAGWFPDDPL
ncbi:MAG: hypothetical protein ACPGGE_05210 [Poseidonia sp.]